jgi:hypothetical protein
VKAKKVLERVYNPGRLRMAWQQVRKNAGAAGIDKMTVEAFERREGELLKLIHENSKRGPTVSNLQEGRLSLKREATRSGSWAFLL